MKKETKIIIGIGSASILGYLYWKKNKKSKKFSFIQSEYNSCVADGNQPIDCCAKLGGKYLNGNCNQQQPISTEETISCPGGTIVNGLCVDTLPPPPPPPPNPTPTPTPTPTPSTTTTTMTLPPLMGVPMVPMMPLGSMGSGNGSGGGQEEKKEFDWIPYILGGMTIALSLVSEN